MRTGTRFEHFLTLATGSLVRAGSIKAVVRDDDREALPIRSLLKSSISRCAMPPAPWDRRVSLLAWDIKGLEQDCLRNWIAKAEWLDPVCALYFGTLYNPSKYLDFNFLALVQAVEAYHRRATEETDQPKGCTKRA